MPQFTVYRNTNTATQAAIPYLLNVQNDLIDELTTRVVIPLYPAAGMQDRIIRTLTPVLDVLGEPYVLMTPQLAGIASRQLGPAIADLSTQRDVIVSALDLLITGL